VNQGASIFVANTLAIGTAGNINGTGNLSTSASGLLGLYSANGGID